MADGDGEGQVNGGNAAAPTVFLSYASEDSAVALGVCEALERSGMACWIAPRDVTPGAFYADEIVHAIDAAKALVLILSRNAAASPHVLREVERATSKRRPVVSLRIDHAPLPAGLEYFLNTSHWLDVSEGEIARVMPKLVAAVRRAVEVPASAVASITTTAAARTSYPSRTGLPQRRLAILAGCLMAVAAAGFAAISFWPPAHRAAVPATAATAGLAAVPTPAPIPEKSVAVLPFVDMSEKKDQEYFSDGLSEELIDMLTKVPDLRVPARTSSFFFKGKQTTIGDIAKMLSVAHVLEGSVRKSGNKLRVTAQLIRVDTGYHVWSQTFDRDAGDIFRIQDDISNAVVGALKVSLGAKAPTNDGVTSSASAYDLYLLAQSSYDRADSKEDYQKIIDRLREAIRIDPSFDRAWAMLSSTLSTMAGYTFNEPTQGFEDARSAALKAIELNPSGADGHRALAKILYVHDWNWEGAELEIKRALAVGPDEPKNLLAAGIVAAKLGRADESVGYVTRAVSRDPLSSIALDVLGQSLMEAGNLKESQLAMRRAQALNPTYSDAHYFLGKVLLLDGKASEALAEFEREVDPQERLPGLALAYHALGRSDEADAALRNMESVVLSGTPGAILIAETYAYRGETDRAFVWLTRSCERREPDCTSMKLDPLLKNLHGDPRYKALLRKLKLPE